MPHRTADVDPLRALPTNSLARFISQLLQCNKKPIEQLSCQIPSGLLQIAVSTMLRTTDIDSGQPLLAEHRRYGTTDFSPTELARAGFA